MFSPMLSAHSIKDYERPILVALSVAGTIITVGLFVVAITRGGSPGFDFFAYYSVDLDDPYTATQGLGAFHYSPVFAQVAQPLKLIPWPFAYWLYLATTIAVLFWLCRRWTLAVLAFPPVAFELYHGNIHIMLAAAIVIGLGGPSAWAFPLLTKVTPAIGALWLALRGHRRDAARAAATVAIIAGVSFMAAPDLWHAWIQHLAAIGLTPTPNQIPVPLLPRLVAAIAILTWGARSDRPWVVAISATLALPILWFHGLALLVALVPLAARRRAPFEPRPLLPLSRPAIANQEVHSGRFVW